MHAVAVVVAKAVAKILAKAVALVAESHKKNSNLISLFE